MPRFQATISYDGTLYNGWQIQPGLPTVQGALAEALHHITGETTLPQGAGRTDTGVHALAQTAHFDLRSSIPPANLHRALNQSLPPAIRILTLTHTYPDFHARHHALHKTYEYRILPRAQTHESICPPTLAPYVWPCPRPLALDLLDLAATQVLGTHDFTSFAAVNPDQSTRNAKATEPSQQGELSSFRKAEGPAFPPITGSLHNIRTIQASTWTLDQTGDPPLLRYRVTGTGFLHHMVRNLVGTFVECGSGRLPPEAISAILAARDRCAAGPTAPPHGLFLTEVAY